MTYRLKHHRFSLARLWPQIGWFAVGFLLFFAIFRTTPATAIDEFVVNIHSDAGSILVRTTGGTVAEILASSGLDVSANDLVEPALDTEITGPVFNINVFRARPVVIDDEGEKQIVSSAYGAARLIAEHAGVKVYREDIVELARVDDPVSTGAIGEKVTIERATPIKFDLYGKRATIRTHAETVADLLEEAEVTPDDNDKITPESSTRLTSGLNVRIIRVGTEVVSTEEVITYSTRTVFDESLIYGQTVVRQEGLNGRKFVTYEIEYHNGQEAKRQVLKEAIIERPQARIVAVGSKMVDAVDNVALGQTLAELNGWTGRQWVCLYELWTHESHWNHLAQNPNSTAFGIPQFLDGTWAATGYQKTADPGKQILAGFVYIENRYGNPCGAWDFFGANNWY